MAIAKKTEVDLKSTSEIITEIQENGSNNMGTSIPNNNVNPKESNDMEELKGEVIVKENDQVMNTQVVANSLIGMQEAFAEEMDGLSISFDRIKIPSGGGLAFEVPSDDPENPTSATEIVGVIVDHHPVNAYYEEKYSGQNNPPDCSSLDAKVGVIASTGECRTCATCPYNQYGSGEGGTGKACKNMHRVYLRKESEVFPVLLTLPPTSLKELSNYIGKRIVLRGLRSYGVVTRITLKKEKSSTGIAYSKAQFGMVRTLNENELKEMQGYVVGIKATTRQNIDLVADTDSVSSTDSNEEPLI
jgi:hypothetical protein